jgi:6-phosphofructokinase
MHRPRNRGCRDAPAPESCPEGPNLWRVARIGLLTGGGDCPGLNAVIRAAVRAGLPGGHSFLGFRHGWAGVLSDEAYELTLERTVGILPRGGTILGTSRTNPFADGRDGVAAIRATLDARAVDALIPIGGEDTLGVALTLHEAGIPIVGVPKTIDNDLGGTDVTFGFQTAVQIVTDAIDRLHTTAESHNRVMVLEVMGRHAGWIATYAGLAGGADAILVPERPFDIDEVCAHLRRRHQRGRDFSIVVVAEGAIPRADALTADGADPRDMPPGETRRQAQRGGSAVQAPAPLARATAGDAFGHARLGGIGVALEREIEARTGFETRVTILGHVQRGGTPVAFDRVLATRFGVAALRAAAAGRFGAMVALRGTAIVEVPLAEALAAPKLLDPELYETAELFFG